MEKLGKTHLIHLLSFFLLLVTVPATLWAKTTVQGQILDPNVEVGDQVRIVVSITSDDGMKNFGDGFKPPQSIGGGALDFVSSSTSSSTSYRIANGKTEASFVIKLTLVYAAFKEGTWTIPKLSLSDDIDEKVGPFTVKVYKNLPSHLQRKNQQQQRPSTNGNGFGSLFKRFFGQDGEGDPFNRRAKPRDEDLTFFSEVEVDKKTVFAGEQIFAKFYIYTNGVITKFDTLKFPTLQGFWKEDVEFANRFNWESVERDGKQYQRAVLSSYVLIPYTSGDYTIDSFDLRATVSAGGFGFVRDSKIFKKKSQEVSVKVLPLNPLPEDSLGQYKGGVGQFGVDILEQGDKKQVLQGETFRLKLKVVGSRSSVKFIEAPDLDLGNEFKLLNVEEDYKFFPAKLSSIKLFTYNLIPLKEGVYKIPDIKLMFHKNYVSELQEPFYYDLTQEVPLIKVKKNPNAKKFIDEDYIELGETTRIKPFKSGWLEKLTAVKIPDYVYYSLLLLTFIGGALIFRKELELLEKTMTLEEKLDQHNKEIETFINNKNFESAATQFINLNYLLVGGLTGKRSSTEEEYLRSLELLPAGLKSKKDKFSEIMKKTQHLRFGTDLRLKENQDKLLECLNKFNKVYADIKPYLRS